MSFVGIWRAVLGINFTEPDPVSASSTRVMGWPSLQLPLSASTFSLDLIQGIDYDEPGLADLRVLWGLTTFGSSPTTPKKYVAFGFATLQLEHARVISLTNSRDDPPYVVTPPPTYWHTAVFPIPATAPALREDVVPGVMLFQGGTRLQFQRQNVPANTWAGEMRVSGFTIEPYSGPAECGPLGGAWVQPPLTVDPAIQDLETMRVDEQGLWTTPDNYGAPNRWGGAQWSVPMPGNQFIEVCVAALSDGAANSGVVPQTVKTGQVMLEVQGVADGQACEYLLASWPGDGSSGYLSLSSRSRPPTGTSSGSIVSGSLFPWPDWSPNMTVCVRFEAHQDGTHRVYADAGDEGATTLRGTAVNPAPNIGDLVGFRMTWSSGATHQADKPHVLWARAGVVGGTCDNSPLIGDWWETGSPGGGFQGGP